jgi:hypothetical protein
MSENRSGNTEVIVFIDFIPNHIKMGLTTAEDSLKTSFDKDLTNKITRARAPIVVCRLGQFWRLLVSQPDMAVRGFLCSGMILCLF